MDATDKKTMHILMGEAVLAVTGRNASLSWTELITELAKMADREPDQVRSHACEQAIRAITHAVCDDMQDAQGGARTTRRHTGMWPGMTAGRTKH